VAAQTQRQIIAIRTVWRYQRVIKIRKSKDRQHNTQKKNDKQRSTNITQKTKDRETWTSLKTEGELITWYEPRCSGRVSSSCSTSDTCRVILVTNPKISHEWGKDQKVLTTSETLGFACL
jgi:hypothetical protein